MRRRVVFQQRVDGGGRAAPLQGHAVEKAERPRLRLREPRDQAMADQGLGGLGQRCQPGGEVDGVSEDVTVRANDATVVEPGVQRERSARAQRQNLACRPQRGRRVFEEAQDVVALGADHRAARLLHGAAQARKAVIDLVQRGGVARRFVERRAAGDVGHQDRGIQFVLCHCMRPGTGPGRSRCSVARTPAPR